MRYLAQAILPMRSRVTFDRESHVCKQAQLLSETRVRADYSARRLDFREGIFIRQPIGDHEEVYAD